MPAGDVFGLDGFFLNVSNPITVSVVDINSTAAGAGITVVSGVLDTTAGIATLTLSTAAGLSTTPFYVGTKIAVSGLSTAGVAYTGYNGNFVVTGFAGTTTVSYATTGYFGSVTAGITTTGLVMLVTDGNVTNTTWSASQTHGWFGGGVSFPGPTNYSTVDRIDFSKDTGTANIRGPLSLARFGSGATGNSNYGWFGSGSINAAVDRIDFSNDSSTTSVRGPLSSIRTWLAATGNSNYGWFGGGNIPGVSTVDRIDFSNDSSTALPRGPLVLGIYSLAATGNSNYGWFGGGVFTPGPTKISRVERIDFSNDFSATSIRGPLSDVKQNSSATGNSNYGWFGGGRSTPSPTILSTVDRIDFSNDSVSASVRGPLSSERQRLSATGNSNYGWFGGGYLSSVPYITTVDRIDFSNDSTSVSVRGSLSAARGYQAATSGQAKGPAIKLQKAGNYGWFGGGFLFPAPISTVDRIDFSNDSSTASVRGPLTTPARYDLAATGNSNYGWFGPGVFTPGPTTVSRVDRIDFSNDSASASPRGPLSSTRYALAATGNSNYGWFGGGSPGPLATVDRINFANDSVSASARGPLSSARFGLAATGNSNYGWFGGGATPTLVATVDRIDFSNDSSTASPRGPLSSARYRPSATGNSNYGWFGGGATPTIVETVDRIDFSNDSVTALARGPLSLARRSLAATGNSNYGWFGGGDSLAPGAFSIVDRINFSNDSVSASPRGRLSSARLGLAATSNSTR